MNRMLAPIILFAYNRPWHTQQVLDNLALNEEAKDSVLYIYCDGAKENTEQLALDNIREVRLLAKNENRFKEIIVKEATQNKGLANSIIDGVTEVVNRHGNIIVLEDDIVVSKGFLKFMNDGLDYYQNNDEVISISAYIYPIEKLPGVFFIKGSDCWGWATWKRGWNLFESDGKKLLAELEQKKSSYEFDFYDSYPYVSMLKGQIEGKNNSWAIRWYASAFLHNKLTLYPGKSLVKNIGFDGSGTHCSTSEEFDVQLEDIVINPICNSVKENIPAKKKMSIYFKTSRGIPTSYTDRTLKFLRRILGKLYRTIFK